MQTNRIAGLAENVNIHDHNNITMNTSSFGEADNTVCSECDDDDDDWGEVEKGISGVPDTLSQVPDKAANADKMISFAPKENKPLGIFIDKGAQ